MPFTPPPQNAFIERMRSRIAEGRQLSVYDYESVVIPLHTTLGPGSTRGTAQFILPSDKRFRLQAVLPTCNIVLPSQEVVVSAGAGRYDVGAGVTNVVHGGTVLERIKAKAHNCVLDLKADSQEYQLNFNTSFRLIDLVAGRVDFFDTPTTFPADTTFDLFASLQDSDASIVGSPTEYGVVLVGQLIRL